MSAIKARDVVYEKEASSVFEDLTNGFVRLVLDEVKKIVFARGPDADNKYRVTHADVLEAVKRAKEC